MIDYVLLAYLYLELPKTKINKHLEEKMVRDDRIDINNAETFVTENINQKFIQSKIRIVFTGTEDNSTFTDSIKLNMRDFGLNISLGLNNIVKMTQSLDILDKIEHTKISGYCYHLDNTYTKGRYILEFTRKEEALFYIQRGYILSNKNETINLKGDVKHMDVSPLFFSEEYQDEEGYITVYVELGFDRVSDDNFITLK